MAVAHACFLSSAVGTLERVVPSVLGPFIQVQSQRRSHLRRRARSPASWLNLIFCNFSISERAALRRDCSRGSSEKASRSASRLPFGIIKPKYNLTECEHCDESETLQCLLSSLRRIVEYFDGRALCVCVTHIHKVLAQAMNMFASEQVAFFGTQRQAMLFPKEEGQGEGCPRFKHRFVNVILLMFEDVESEPKP